MKKQQPGSNNNKQQENKIYMDKIANIIVSIATSGLGLDFGSLLGTLKAGISNEDESQAYHKTKVFKNS